MILDQIVAHKKKEVEQARVEVSQEELIKRIASLGSRRSFKQAVSQPGKLNLIAEIKKASPSKGMLRQDFNPVEIARAYQAAGACALSIITDKKFFQGDITYLKAAREAVSLPVLRKDFIIDQYQLYQSVCAGADSVLLIIRLLSPEQLAEFSALCAQLNLEALCEVHNEEDLEKALSVDCELIGINNRNLDTFVEDLQVSARLIKKIPKGKILVSESAIRTAEDVKYLQGLGVNAVLIGEAFMRSPDINAKIEELMPW
jgi:indole-3-glycerol phosphate synthase